MPLFCKVEINKAAQNNKRIIPIVLRDVHPKETPETISKLNWTFMRETDNFDEGLAKVKTAIELDLDWLEEHRRLQVRALEWERKKDISLLLRGRDLRNARHMVATATSKDPTPSDLQKAYIQHSQRTERNRTIALVAGSVALIAMAILSFLAVRASNEAQIQREKAEVNAEHANTNAILANQQRQRAEENKLLAEENARQAEEARKAAEAAEVLAKSQRSAARAQIYLNRPGELYTSALLAINSLRRDPTSGEAEEILRRNINLLPIPLEQFAQADKIHTLLFHPDGNTFITASDDGSVCAWTVEEEKISNIFCTAAEGVGVNALAFNRDGSLLVTGDQAGIVRILDPQTGEVVREFGRTEAESGGRAQIAEIKSGDSQEQLSLRNIPVRSISIRPTLGQLLVATYDDGQIPVFDPVTGKIISRLSLVSRPNVSGVSPNGAWLVAGSETGQVTGWNLGTGKPFSTSTHRGGVLAMAFSPRENKVVTAGSNSLAISNLSIEKELYRVLIQKPHQGYCLQSRWFLVRDCLRRSSHPSMGYAHRQ